MVSNYRTQHAPLARDYHHLRDIPVLHALLRREYGVSQSYEQSVAQFDGTALNNDVWQLCRNHRDMLARLQERVCAYGGDPETGFGLREWLATAMTVSAQLIGWRAVLAALHKNEKWELNDCLTALEREQISSDCRQLLQSDMIPHCRFNLDILTHLEAAS